MSDSQTPVLQHDIVFTEALARLNPTLVRQVDEALARVGAFGEVRLIVVKGRLRFIQVMKSESVQG